MIYPMNKFSYKVVHTYFENQQMTLPQPMSPKHLKFIRFNVIRDNLF